MFTYNDALKYLNSFVNYERSGLDLLKGRFDLGRLRKVLGKMKDPQRCYPSVHIAGTKGKGSISVFTSSILAQAGYRVGLFTSPHLGTIRERISIDARIITEEELVRAVGDLRRVIGPRSGFERFSFFEVYTLLAILYFRMKKVDYAVFECGLGGRLDATNVIDGAVCGFAPISYDHVQILGGKIAEIAGEKAAIIKENSRCVSSPQRPTVLRVVEDKCREKTASLSVVGKDITCRLIKASENGVTFDLSSGKREYKACHTAMLGDFQAENCATAVGICEQLMESEKGDRSINAKTVKKGISRAFLPGRMEILCQRPFLVIDGAQNGASAARLKYSIEQIFKYDKLILLLGLSRDKDIIGICRELVPLADEVILTRASVERAMDPALLKGYIKGKKACITRDVEEGLGMAFSRTVKDDLILATGSFFVIGEVRRLMVGM